MSQTAVVNYARESRCVELRDIDRPAISADQVLVEVAAVSVCGSDLHQWIASHSWPVNYPVVLGHEFCGTIVETGANVLTWKEGDRVASETAAVIDANSPLVRQGLYNLDPTRLGFGYGVNGAMTSHVAVPSRCLHTVPEELPWERAALTEPCCVAYNAVVANTDIKPWRPGDCVGAWSDWLAVRGDGPALRSRGGGGRARARSGSTGDCRKIWVRGDCW